ncbi:MAG TPA: SDR family NAD(P)-dependent oxidoreductase [Candidatus Poseidoniaceae archaeon]|nr:MAG TPA: SDR family NAD(P)-dependent oxidoreductase [Candidatus Poseidoniales archaeon]HIH52915.1 SDR family NAD(P)-dependent oxidoreductase [Candidatus Poseidoniaceae archaeon]
MVWVVTGGTKGLGRSLVMALVNEGHTVVAMGRDASALAELHDGERIHAVHVDLADPEAIASAATEVLALPPVAASGVSGLLHNAGDVAPVGAMSALDDAAWARALQVNLVGVQQLTRGLWTGLVAGRARVVTISSGASLRPIHGWSAYCASKAALDMWTRSLAVEGQVHGITAVAVAPGIVDTGMQQAIRDAGPEGFPAHPDFVGYHENGDLVAPDVVAERLLPVLLDVDGFGSGERFDVRNL